MWRIARGLAALTLVSMPIAGVITAAHADGIQGSGTPVAAARSDGTAIGHNGAT